MKIFIERILNWLTYWQHLKKQKRSGKIAEYSIPRLNIKTGVVSVSIRYNKPAEYITISFSVKNA